MLAVGQIKGTQPWCVDVPLTILVWLSCIILMCWAYYAFSVLGDLVRGDVIT